MTDAHAKAVEAAANWYQYEMSSSREDAGYLAQGIITAYLAAMRAEGWVMVRDVGMSKHDNLGWNACRAIMLGGAGDGQG